jgi:hypothetical protein
MWYCNFLCIANEEIYTSSLYSVRSTPYTISMAEFGWLIQWERRSVLIMWDDFKMYGGQDQNIFPKLT